MKLADCSRLFSSFDFASKIVKLAGNQQGIEHTDSRQRQLWSDIRAEAKLDAVS